MSVYIGLPHAVILARLTAVVAKAAGAQLAVRVSDESHAHRNVGVDLPRARTKVEALRLRLRVTGALSAAGVLLAEHALVPNVGGGVRGQVQVAEVVRTRSLGASC